MTKRLLRLAYAFEFLVAIVAVFTAWSEIGGQDALDLMHWGWKLGLGLGMSGAIVAYTGVLVSEPSAWSPRAARRLTALLLVAIAMGAVTYYYALQVEKDSSDEEKGTPSHDISRRRTPDFSLLARFHVSCEAELSGAAQERFSANVI
jgi:hypothetical protein